MKIWGSRPENNNFWTYRTAIARLVAVKKTIFWTVKPKLTASFCIVAGSECLQGAFPCQWQNQCFRWKLLSHFDKLSGLIPLLSWIVNWRWGFSLFFFKLLNHSIRKVKFLSKIQFWQNPSILTSFSPIFILTIFLVKSELR